jgi:hypothetical protein
MTSRKLDLVVERINDQNELDGKLLYKGTKINSRFVDHRNKNREYLHFKTNFRERRFQNGRRRNELMKLTTISPQKTLRGNTVDTKMNTYKHQNFLLDPESKDNIFNYIDNTNYVLDKNEKYYHDYHKNMLQNMSFYNFHKDRYFADIFDKFYNNNNDKKWMSNDIYFFLNRAVYDELKEDKDFKEANKLNRYAIFLRNKDRNITNKNMKFYNKHIDAKTRYNDFYLDRDDLLIQKVNDLREGKNDKYNEQERDYYHKVVLNKEDLEKKRQIEEDKRKNRENRIKKMEDERNQKMKKILEKENNKFRFANRKENSEIICKKNSQIKTVKDREDIETKSKEVEIRNDRILKGQTVYKKGIYEMPFTNYL